MKRYLVLPLALLISSPAYSMEKSPSSMKKMEPKNWVQQRDGTFIAMGEYTATYQNPIKIIGDNKYELRKSVIAKSNNFLEQKELTINPRMKLSELQNRFFDAKNTLEAFQKEGVQDPSKAIAYAQLLVEKKKALKQLQHELNRRIWTREAGIIALQKTLDKKGTQLNANTTIIEAQTTRLKKEEATLEARKSRLASASSENPSRPAGKRNMLVGTLVVAEDVAAQAAFETALAQSLIEAGNAPASEKIARELLKQHQVVQNSQATLDQRLAARQNTISALKARIESLQKENQVLNQEYTQAEAQKTAFVHDVDALGNWLAHPTKIETPKKGWLSYLGL